MVHIEKELLKTGSTPISEKERKDLLEEIDRWSKEFKFKYFIEDNFCYISSYRDIDQWKFKITKTKDILLLHKNKCPRDNFYYHKHKICNNIEHLFKHINQHDSKYFIKRR